MFIVCSLLGLIVGFAMAGDAGAVFGGAIGALFGLYGRLVKRVAALEGALDERSVERRPSDADQQAPEEGERAEARPATESRAEALPPAPDVALGGPSSAPRADAPPAGANDEPLDNGGSDLAPPSAPLSGIAQRLLRGVQSFLKGGNPLVRAGVVVLFFGVGFLVKLASDRGLLPIELRLAAVATGGMALLSLGWWLRARRRGYALVLQGGGIAVLYLCVFASFRLYHLLPASAAFALLVLLVICSGVLAVLQDARTIAVLGAAGGFVAPIIASTGSGSHVALFGYYVLLNAGIVSIAWFKSWRILNLLGFIFTFGIGTLWGYRFYDPIYFHSTEPFLIAFFLIYVAVAVLFALRQPPDLKGYVDGTLVFGTPLVAFGLQARLVAPYEMGLTYSAFALAAFYVLLAWVLFKRVGARTRLICEAFIGLGVVFATLAIPLTLDAQWTGITWALEGAGILWVGLRQHRLAPRLFGLLMQPAAGAAFFAAVDAGGVQRAFFNTHYLAAALIALAGLFSGWYLHRYRDVLRSFEGPFVVGVAVWGLLWWFGAGVIESMFGGGIERYRWGIALLFVASSSTGAVVLGERAHYPVLRRAGWVLLPALLLAATAMAASEPHPFARLGWLGWPLAMMAHLFVLARFEHTRRSRLLAYSHAAGLWLVTAICALEAAWWVVERVHVREWGAIAWGLAPAAVVLATSYGSGRLSWPLVRHAKSYLVYGCGPIALALCLWIFHVNAQAPGSAWPIRYLPFLNPIDVATGFALVAIVHWWRLYKRHAERHLLEYRHKELAGVLGLTLFYWLNAILVRSVHFYADVPFELGRMFDSTVLQTSVAVFWGVLGLCIMVFAARRAIRALWFAGTGLMVVVVAKLFLVDLASTGTMARIVSFITVGVLLLVVGYFAPAPPRASIEGARA